MTRNKCVAGLLALSIVAGCGFLGGADKQLKRAEAALASGNYGEAVVLLRNVAEDDPARADVRLLLARALFQSGDIAGAQRTLQVAIESGADRKAALELQSSWSLATGNYKEVLEAVESSDSPFDELSRIYFRARALLGLGRADEALPLFSGLAARQPQSADLQLRIAQSHAYFGRVAAAQAALEKTLALPANGAPVTAEALLLKAALARSTGDADAAAAAQEQAIAAAPGELNAFQQAQLLTAAVDRSLRIGDLAEAEQYRSSLAKVLPRTAITRQVTARVQLHDGNIAVAVGDLQKLLQEQAESTAARTLLIAGQLRAGALEQALSEANKVAAAAADDESAKRVQQLIRAAADEPDGSAGRALLVADALSALEQPGLARAHVAEALGQHTESALLKLTRARLELRSGRTTEALQQSLALLGEHPDNLAVQLLVGEAQATSGNLTAAVATYETLWQANPSARIALELSQLRRRANLPQPHQPLADWLATQPKDVAVRLNLAIALQQSGDLDKAAREFERVIADSHEGQPLQALARNNLAVLYAQRSDPRALDMAKRAYAVSKDLPAVEDTYGWVLLQQGDALQALPHLKAAAAASPASAEIRYHYAAALAATGNKDAARALLNDVLLAESFNGRADAAKLLTTL